MVRLRLRLTTPKPAVELVADLAVADDETPIQRVVESDDEDIIEPSTKKKHQHLAIVRRVSTEIM